jgi:cytochrome c-type biogenesis protein CcmH
LKEQPTDVEGWAMLARSYKALGRLPEAEAAYAKAGQLVDTDPDLLADYADLLAARAGNSLAGQPMVLINKALALNPLHPMSLMLAGNAAYQQGNYAGAVKHWENLLSVMEPDSPDLEQLRADIAEARAKAGMAASSLSGAAPKATEPVGAGQKPSPEQILQMVNNLAARQKANPGDLAGWARLARSYKVLGRLPEAAEAYAKAGKLVDSDPDMLTDYADVLATQAGNNLEGRPLVLINKALALNPLHPKGLMLSGTAALRRSDYAGAVATWEKLMPLFQPGSPDAQWLTASIAEARAKGGLGVLALGKK